MGHRVLAKPGANVAGLSSENAHRAMIREFHVSGTDLVFPP